MPPRRDHNLPSEARESVNSVNGSAEDRRTRLLELIRGRGFASLPELAHAFDVSESTIRRDLDALEETGSTKRTHGGVFYTGPGPHLPRFETRQQSQWGRKQRIARRAAELIEEADTILLDGGSTTYELARVLLGRPLQVVTNSLPVAELFASDPVTDLVFLGGYIHPRTGVSLGPYATEMLERLSVRRAVISVAGVSELGLYNSNLLLVETEQAMIKSADEVIVVADSSKFGRRSLARLGDLGVVHTVVSDEGLSDDWRARLTEAGVQVLIAADDPSDGTVTQHPSPAA